MPLRQYWKWNIEGFCKSYFGMIADPKSPMLENPHKICNMPIKQRCKDPRATSQFIEDIQISMADCRSYAQKNKKMQAQYEIATQSVRCALQCSNIKLEPQMTVQEYIFHEPHRETFFMPLTIVHT